MDASLCGVNVGIPLLIVLESLTIGHNLAWDSVRWAV